MATERPRRRAASHRWLGVLSVVVLSALTAYVQADKLGLHYIDEGTQLLRHEAVLRGDAGDPWQYRLLSEYLVEGVLLLARRLPVSHPVALGFVGFRVVQNLCIFILAAMYYRRIGLGPWFVLVGQGLIAWAMAHCLYDSDLQLNTYSDVVFYLVASLLILDRRYAGFTLVAGAAALNRETSALLPFLPLAYELRLRPIVSVPRPAWLTAAIAVAVCAAVFVALRLLFGRQTLIIAYGHEPGWDLLAYNMGRAVTWKQLFATFTVVPLVAVISIRYWPRIVYRSFLLIVPAWLVVHFLASVVAETRVMLVPYVLIFVPGALFGLAAARARWGGKHANPQRDAPPSERSTLGTPWLPWGK